MAMVLQLTKPLLVPPQFQSCGAGRIRTFGDEADIEPWLALRRAAFARQRVGVREWLRGDFEAEFLSRWWWQPERMWLAESSEATPQLIGAVTLAFRGTPEDSRPVVHWLLVDPRWRRRGVARALLSQLEACCWELGHRQIWLETHEQWQAAAEFYRGMGYVPTQ